MKYNFIFYYPSIESGGLEKNLFFLVNSLSKKNYKVKLLTYANNINLSKFKKKFFFDKNIYLITSNLIRGINNRYLKYIICSFRLFFFMLTEKGTIVSFQGNILPIAVAKITGNKIIIRCNTAPSKYIDNIFKKYFFKFFYSLSDMILVTSEDFKKEIKKYFNLTSKVHKQSLDLKDIKKKSKVNLNFGFFKNFRGLKIINIGRLIHQKNQIILLKAFLELIKYRKAKLLLIGSGSDEKVLRNFIKQNKIQNLVKIIQFTNNPFKYISLCDIKILSSRFEGNPNILLETACLKKLIISSDCKVGPREILQSGKGGILFRVGDYKGLSLILKNININSIHIRKKINISYEYVKNNFKKDISGTFINLINKI